MERIAVLDLDTTKIDLLIAEVQESTGHFTVISERSETIKFSEDMGADGLIKQGKINDAMRILRIYKVFCDINKVTETIAVAAPAVKNMKNQRSFFEEAYNATGFKFKILATEEELSAIYTGVINMLDVPKALIIDVTASSTNFVYYNRRNVLNQSSIPVGAYTLTQLFAGSCGSPEELCKRMTEYFSNELKPLTWLKELDPEFAFVGTGSSFINAGRLSRKLKRYPVDIEHNYPMKKEDFAAVYDLVKTLDLDKSKKIKGIGKDRADVLASGICIIKAVMDFIKIPAFVVSEKQKKEGLIFNYAVPITHEKPISDLLGFSLESINLFYDKKEGNAKQVGELALVLFRQLKVLHKLGRGYLKVLRIASMMHDSGRRIKFYDHEKNSFSVILNSDITGASQREIVLASFVSASQNSEDFSLTEWVKYQSMVLEEDLPAIKKLAIIVRLAEALDVTHRNLVQDISCDILGDSVIMKTIVTGDASIEIREALKAGGDFRKAYGKNLEVL